MQIKIEKVIFFHKMYVITVHQFLNFNRENYSQ